MKRFRRLRIVLWVLRIALILVGWIGIAWAGDLFGGATGGAGDVPGKVAGHLTVDEPASQP